MEMKCSNIARVTAALPVISRLVKMATPAPKRKAEYVALLKQRTAVPDHVLEKMTVEKLRLLYQTTKPVAVKPLPTNWRRFSKAALQELYMTEVLPAYGESASKTAHLSWGKDRLIVELSNFAEEIKAETEEKVKVDPTVPMCQQCAIPMVQRTNRMTGQKFWGCMVYPSCTFTLSLQYAGVDAAEAQRRQGGYSKPPTGLQTKQQILESNEEMDGEVVKRALRTPVPAESAASWDLLSHTSQSTEELIKGAPGSPSSPKLALTAEEVKMIKELRKSKEEKK